MTEQTKHSDKTDTYNSETSREMRIGNTRFVIVSVFGDAPIEEIMTDYVTSRVMDELTADNAA